MIKLSIPAGQQKKEYTRLSLSVSNEVIKKIKFLRKHTKAKDNTALVEILVNSVYESLKAKA